MHTQKRSSRSASFLIGALVIMAVTVAATRFDLVGHFAYAVEKGRLRATAEELAQVEQADRVIGMVAEMVRPAVVNITTTSGIDEARESERREIPEALRRRLPPGFEFPAPRRPQQGVGSGVIIDAEKGYIVTNNHVVAGADRITVRLHDRRKFNAELLGADESTDLAVIRITPDRLHELEFGDSDAMHVGATVLAVGSPFRYEQTVTKGIVSARHRTEVIPTLNYQNFIQTDAAINPGNSGGPLVNIRGEIIGINTVIATTGNVAANMGVGFAIPSNMVQRYLPRLIEGEKIVRGFLGVIIKDVSDFPGMAEAFGWKENRGVLIDDVLPGGPGDKSGLRSGDIVLAFGNRKIDRKSELSEQVALTLPDSTVPVRVWRDGKHVTVQVTVEQQADDFSTRLPARGRRARPGASPNTAEAEELGIEVAELTAELAEQHGWDVEQDTGVMVTKVKPGSEANGAIEVGYLITKINRQDVKNVRDFRRLIKDQSLERGILLYVRSKKGEVTRGSHVYLKVG